MIHTPEDQFATALAHQLKTPASALQAATANLRRNLRGLLEDLAALSRNGEASAQTARFISRAVNDPPPRTITGLLPEERVDVIVRRLADEGVDGDLGVTAASLVRGGWDAYLEEIAPLLRADQPLALDLLETAARLRANLASVETSLEKIRGVASALRLLTLPVEGGSVDIASSLEPTLSLLRETLPDGVLVVTRLEGVPPVVGRADLLSQVWTNLLTNAAEAVGERGTITVEAGPLPEAGRAAVRVIDDGPGIPPRLQSRVFEPFFTTRAAEGGSGMGLSLARQIVEKLGGSVAVESRPGLTCFQVTLPIAASAFVREA